MSNQRLPNEDAVHRVSDAEELVGPHMAMKSKKKSPVPLPYQRTRKKKMQQVQWL
ncbi:MAG: hypothetical protein M3270_04685 [Thermoproteota archaeon]|nr:hypothetical protein [Thermoproteota archaeon]